MLRITDSISLPFSEIEIHQIRSSGPGGQNVNKVSTAVHLRLDIVHSSLPDFCKKRLLSSRDRRITNDGCIIIKAQQFRSLEQNKTDAFSRLAALISAKLKTVKNRKPTKPTSASRRRRLDWKQKHSRQKMLRKKVKNGE